MKGFGANFDEYRRRPNMNIYIIQTHFGAVQIKTGKIHALPTDKRTKKGKMRAKYFEAIETIAKTAYELDCEIEDISPVF